VRVPLRIALIAPNRFPIRPPFAGGLEAHVRHLARVLTKAGHRVSCSPKRVVRQPISDPPIEHLADIIANAIVFEQRWGWWPMQGRTGVARLALTTDAAVVPVAQWGPQRLHDYHTKTWHLRFRTPADYLVGEPIDLDEVRAEVRAGRPLSADLLRGTTDLIMGRVRDLLGDIRGETPPATFSPRPALPGDASGSAA